MVLTSKDVKPIIKGAIEPVAEELKLVRGRPKNITWCVECEYYVINEVRNFMFCKKRGGRRLSNAGETCEYFKKKKKG